MAITCPIGFDVARLRDQVLATYDRVAREPGGEFHFHRGAAYAVEFLRYDAAELALLPVESLRALPESAIRCASARSRMEKPCSTTHAAAAWTCCSRRVGPEGRVIGVDMTPAMRDVATKAAAQAGFASIVDIRAGFFEELPVEDESVDVVISNGVVNLAPDKGQVFREIQRVLRPGGRLHLAHVVVQRELKQEVREDPDLWAACVAGALPESEVAELALATGFREPRIVERFDCFRDTSAEAKVARDLHIQAVNFSARK